MFKPTQISLRERKRRGLLSGVRATSPTQAVRDHVEDMSRLQCGDNVGLHAIESGVYRDTKYKLQITITRTERIMKGNIHLQLYTRDKDRHTCLCPNICVVSKVLWRKPTEVRSSLARRYSPRAQRLRVGGPMFVAPCACQSRPTEYVWSL